MDIKFRNRLSYLQTKRTVIVALLLGVALSMAQIFYEFIIEKRAMDSTVSQVVGMIKESATMAAYNLDAEHAQNILRGLFEYQAIRRATIVNEYNEILGNKERPLNRGPLNAIVNLFFGPETQLDYPLNYDKNKSVGILSVTIDRYFAAQRWISKAGVVIITGVVRNFVLAIIFTLIFYYSLTLPFVQVIRSIAGVDPRNPAGVQLEVPQTHRKNEMGILIGTLNRLLSGFTKSLEERKAAEARLVQSERKYRNIFENSNDGIFQTTKEGRLRTANTMLAKILRFDSPQDLLETMTDIRKIYVEPKDRERLLARVETDGIVRDFRTEIYRKDGTKAPVAVTIHAVKDAEGNLLYLEGNLEDISEKQRTEKMRIEKEAAEAANSAKSEFLANMSHEIRTPMNGIIGNTALAQETELTQEQCEYLQAIRISADHLMGVINDVLDFSKIEAGHMELEETEFTLRMTIENAVESLAVKAHEKGLELVSNVDADVPDYLIGDPGRLRQIIVNLLGNAVKFTDDGEVVVFCEIKKQQGTGVWLHFSVSDTGIGIAAEKLETIFESFKQADGSTTRRYGGTGLGLTISKQLVELMGGRIWVQSPADGSKSDDTHDTASPGTTFHFTVRFDLQPNPEVSPIDTQTIQIQDKRVLIVDDNATNLKILSRMLSNWGVVHRQANEGQSALAELERAAAEADLTTWCSPMDKCRGWTGSN